MATAASEQELVKMKLGFIGCGSLGTAILHGIDAGIAKRGANTLLVESCAISVRSEDSTEQIRTTFAIFPAPLSVHAQGNFRVVAESDTIILAVPPDDVVKVLGTPGMRDALHGKLLISLAAGVTRSQMDAALYGGTSVPANETERCHIIRAMPNLAVAVGQSMTALDLTDLPPPPHHIQRAEELFKMLGSIIHVPEQHFNACTFLCGSTPAAVALFCDAMIDGAVAAGVPRKTAQPIVVQILYSAAALMQDGKSPSDLREHVCAQPGCTIGAIMTLERGGARGVIASATQDGVLLASGLGQKKE